MTAAAEEGREFLPLILEDEALDRDLDEKETTRMEVKLDMTYNEPDSILTVIGDAVSKRRDGSTRFTGSTLECLKSAESKIEEVFINASPDDE